MGKDHIGNMLSCAAEEVLVIDYALETQQSVLIQGMGAETRLSVSCCPLAHADTQLEI